ncbi:MAG TPA: hypothetical protein VMZ29_11645 [Candidatus Bathyarchaeia archaeon]|nr:hypothetical protein [Candidatus Bathyarchaeia archaeon]
MASESQKPTDNIIRINIKEDITYFLNGQLKMRVTTTEVEEEKT